MQADILKNSNSAGEVTGWQMRCYGEPSQRASAHSAAEKDLGPRHKSFGKACIQILGSSVTYSVGGTACVPQRDTANPKVYSALVALEATRFEVQTKRKGFAEADSSLHIAFFGVDRGNWHRIRFSLTNRLAREVRCFSSARATDAQPLSFCSSKRNPLREELCFLESGAKSQDHQKAAAGSTLGSTKIGVGWPLIGVYGSNFAYTLEAMLGPRATALLGRSALPAAGKARRPKR